MSGVRTEKYVRTKKRIRLLLKIMLSIIGLVAAYALIGLILSLIPVNGNVVPNDGIVIYLYGNGVHTDIVLPTRTEQFDWTTVVPPCDTSSKRGGDYLSIGWGVRDFYLNVPEFKDLTLGIALKAISGVGATALHTTYRAEPIISEGCRRLSISTVQYNALVQYILSSGKRNEHGSFIRVDHSGYGQSDAFYEGTGHYNPFFTCNTWANSALKVCEQKCCLWTALSQPIFWKYPQK